MRPLWRSGGRQWRAGPRFPLLRQHPFRDVQPQHTAALKWRQHRLQRGPSARARKAKLRACPPAVFFKKYGVVVSAFFHAVCLLCIFLRHRAEGAADELFCGYAQGSLVLRGVFVTAGNEPHQNAFQRHNGLTGRAGAQNALVLPLLCGAKQNVVQPLPWHAWPRCPCKAPARCARCAGKAA